MWDVVVQPCWDSAEFRGMRALWEGGSECRVSRPCLRAGSAQGRGMERRRPLESLRRVAGAMRQQTPGLRALVLRAQGLRRWRSELPRLALCRFGAREPGSRGDAYPERPGIGWCGWVMLRRGRRQDSGRLLPAPLGSALRIASQEVRRIDGRCSRRNLTGDAGTDSRRWLQNRRRRSAGGSGRR